MKKMLSLLLCLTMLVGLAACSAKEETAVGGEEAMAEEVVSSGDMADWTVMFYLCGTDLETDGECASVNLEEVLYTEPNDRVNFVVETGGTYEWHSEDYIGLEIANDRLQRYHFDEDGYTLDEEQPLQSMAQAETLTDFITWSEEMYPAEKYMLVLWDHGGGSRSGLIVDQIFHEAMMSLEDLDRSLEDSGVHFEAILFDCCLMANVENARHMQEHADYMIASEESVAGCGTNFTGWLQYLYDRPECDGADIGRAVCETMMQKYSEWEDTDSIDWLTFSVLDLNAMEPLNEAYDRFFTEALELLDDPYKYYRFADAIWYSEHYAHADQVDILDMVEDTRGCGISDETVNELVEALEDVVIYNIHGAKRCYSGGLSFYYKPNGEFKEMERYGRNCLSAPYLAFMDAVNPRWTAPEWVYEVVERPAEVSYDFVVDADTELTEDGELYLNIGNGLGVASTVDAVLYMYDETTDNWLRLGRSSSVDGDFTSGIFRATFPEDWITYDGHFLEMKIQEEKTDYTIYDLPIYSVENDTNYSIRMGCEICEVYADEEWTDEEETEEADLTEEAEDTAENEVTTEECYEVYGLWNGISNSSLSLPGRDVTEMRTLWGYTIRPVLTMVNITNNKEIGPLRTEGFWAKTTSKLTFEALPAGEYAYAFVTTDVFGNEYITKPVLVHWDGETAVFEMQE